jgi:poly(A) polymerase
MTSGVTSTSASLADAAWLRAPQTQAVLGCLAARGFAARVVGGAVRNALLDLPVTDIDIATTATPDGVIEAAKVAGLKTVATGLAHGTVTVIVEGKPFEVTTLRSDVATDGRHATVAFTDDWALDASRRDLTLNALYCNADGTLFDPLGGLDDLRARRIRFIGSANQRIREDYLRILRFFRFTASFAVGPSDADGLAAAVAERAGLARLSAERVRAELSRLLVAPRAFAVVDTMAAHGLLTAILPVAPRLGIFARLIAIEQAADFEPNSALRLASLAIAVAEDADRMADHLRLSGAERDVLVRASEGAVLQPGLDERAQRAALYRLGPEAFRETVLLGWAKSDAAPGDTLWRQLLDLPRRWTAPKQPFAGRDLLTRGLAPGPRIGQILAAFETWWIGEDFPADPVVLEAQLEQIRRRI